MEAFLLLSGTLCCSGGGVCDIQQGVLSIERVFSAVEGCCSSGRGVRSFDLNEAVGLLQEAHALLKDLFIELGTAFSTKVVIVQDVRLRWICPQSQRSCARLPSVQP